MIGASACLLVLFSGLGSLPPPDDRERRFPAAGVRLRIPDGTDHSLRRRAGGVEIEIRPEGDPGLVAWRLRVRLEERPDRVEESRRIRDAWMARIASNRDLENGERISIATPAGEFLGVRAVSRASGRVFRVEQGVLYTVDRRLEISAHAPVDRWSEARALFVRLHRSLELTPLDAEARRDLRIDARIERLDGSVGWAPDFETALRRARAEDRLVLAYARFYPGFELEDGFLVGPWADEDVRSLIRRRFVPVRVPRAGPSPLHDEEAYGLGPNAFGSALFVLDADGRRIAETFSDETPVVDAFLRRALAKAGKTLSGRASDPWEAVRAGDFAAALAAVRGENTSDAWLLRAHVARRDLSFDEASSALARAEACLLAAAGTVPPELGQRLVWERLRLEAAAGRWNAALAGLEQWRQQAGSLPEAARLLEAVAAWRTGNTEEAERRLLVLATADSQAPEALAAAALLRSPALAIADGRRLGRVTRADVDEALPPAYEPLPYGERRRALREAVEFLLGRQRPDGSFPVPSGMGRDPALDPFSVAIAAIAARSLLDVAGDPRAAASAVRALGFLERARERQRAEGAIVAFMDYWVWARAFEILAFAEAASRAAFPLPAARAAIADRTEDLLARRIPGGGFTYYVSGEIGGPPDRRTITFVTAQALRALHAAVDEGAKVPAEVFADVESALLRARGEGGFAYMIAPKGRGGPGPDAEVGASGRGPLLAHALFERGRLPAEEIGNELERFLRHLPEIRAEAGKAIMHAGPGGLGCHYVLFDLLSAAEAAAVDRRFEVRARRPIVETLLALRTADGGYLDAPFLGRVFGAAVAVRVLSLFEAPARRGRPPRRPF